MAPEMTESGLDGRGKGAEVVIEEACVAHVVCLGWRAVQWGLQGGVSVTCRFDDDRKGGVVIKEGSQYVPL